MDSSNQTIHVSPARFVTIELASRLIGLTDKAIRRKIEDGIWAEGKQYRRRDGRVFVDWRAVDDDTDQASPFYGSPGSINEIFKLLLQATGPTTGAGVYFLLQASGDITYVGQSQNVLKRMAGHSEKEFHAVKMIPIEDERHRLATEAMFIALLKPKDNVQGTRCSHRITAYGFLKPQ